MKLINKSMELMWDTSPKGGGADGKRKKPATANNNSADNLPTHHNASDM